MSASEIQRVGIIFSGGPAPAANAVISSAAISFLESGREVVGFFHGYSNLQHYHPSSHRLLPDTHYRVFTQNDIWGLRNTPGIIIGTARANPGKTVTASRDLRDADKTQGLQNVYSALVDLGVDALISIGGDDTLKTANLFHEYQQQLPPQATRVRVVHLPKTIDNDYRGIDFTFGFFTAVDVMAKELSNLRADAMATSAYYIVETMGRKAGWLSYGVAIAGEANMVFAAEDIDEALMVDEESLDSGTGRTSITRRLNLELLADRIVELILTRENRDGKHFGTVVLAEGIAELLSERHLTQTTRDEHGHLSLGKVDLGKLVATMVAARYKERTGRMKKINGIQLGYEARCAPPHAFDVILGSQLGIGAYRALIEEGLDAHMVSCGGQLELFYVPFKELIDADSLKTDVRLIQKGSDFYRLARFLETRVEPRTEWSPGPRPEG